MVVAERDSDGQPYIPTYYKSRIHIDLSESDKYSTNFETLLRWIFNKPLHVKPPLGAAPTFLMESTAITLGTSALAKRTLDAIKSDKSYSKGVLAEYLETYAQNLNRFRVSEKKGELDDQIVAAIEAFMPSRNEFIQIISALIQYDSRDSAHTLHRFIESLLPYYERPEQQTSWDQREFDHFKYIVHELFLYILAIYLRQEDYSSANYLLSTPYYLANNAARHQESAVSYTEIHEHIETLDHRNKRLSLRRLSLRADFLEKNSKSSGLQFRYLMQADFICFMRSELTKASIYGGWWPETLIYANRSYGAFEIFARAASKTYLAKVLPVLGITEINSVKTQLTTYANDRQSLPRWQHESFSPATLLGIDQLGTKA